MAHVIIQPSTFRELFESMGDVYNGAYEDFLEEYSPSAETPANLLTRTINSFPCDQVPPVFMYQDPMGVIRTVHHLHRADTPFGQPVTPLTNKVFGFVGEVYNSNVFLVEVPEANFFSSTGNLILPTVAHIRAQLPGAEHGTLGPYREGDPDTEVDVTRRAVPVPYAYVHLVAFRTLSAREAWQQVGEQVLLDGREDDCDVLLTFLRAALVVTRGGGRNPVNGNPATVQPAFLTAPYDGPVLQHVNRRLRQVLPGAFATPPDAPPAGATALLINQTMAEGFDALRADRIQEREMAAALKPFDEVFPSGGLCIRRLCLVDQDDDLLPQFWKFFAKIKGKKAAGMQMFDNYVTVRTKEDDSAGVLPIVSTSLFTNIASLNLGAKDIEDITQGVSPFLMCPTGYRKVDDTMVLSTKYMMIHAGDTAPNMADMAALLPSKEYNLPDSVYSLVDFIGAYSIIWDVLVGTYHPLALALRSHHKFWVKQTRATIAAIPDEYTKTALLIGVMRRIQIITMNYVNEAMYTDDEVPHPSFADIEDKIVGRMLSLFPSLPPHYKNTSSLPLPPPLKQAPTPPTTKNPNMRGNEVTAPPHLINTTFLEAFFKSGKTIPQLRDLDVQPKTKNGSAVLCLSYHLRGKCADNCRKIATHRKLEPEEESNMKAFIKKNL